MPRRAHSSEWKEQTGHKYKNADLNILNQWITLSLQSDFYVSEGWIPRRCRPFRLGIRVQGNRILTVKPLYYYSNKVSCVARSLILEKSEPIGPLRPKDLFNSTTKYLSRTNCPIERNHWSNVFNWKFFLLWRQNKKLNEDLLVLWTLCSSCRNHRMKRELRKRIKTLE